MGITTKTGDDGKSRWQGKTEDKDGALIETIGALDEVMAILQIIMLKVKINKLEQVVGDLHDIMGELAYDKRITNYELRIMDLEEGITNLESKLPKINKFIYFEEENGAMLNWARTVVRRVERRIVTLDKKRKVDKHVLVYINRLSDYLFMLSRYQK